MISVFHCFQNKIEAILFKRKLVDAIWCLAITMLHSAIILFRTHASRTHDVQLEGCSLVASSTTPNIIYESGLRELTTIKKMR